MPARAGVRILVPVFGGDISATTEARARRALATPGARLAIVHVATPRDATRPAARAARPADGAAPRWRRLAEDAGAFVDAVAGSRSAVVATQARRFASDVVIADRPARPPHHHAKPRRQARREMTAC